MTFNGHDDFYDFLDKLLLGLSPPPETCEEDESFLKTCADSQPTLPSTKYKPKHVVIDFLLDCQ